MKNFFIIISFVVVFLLVFFIFQNIFNTNKIDTNQSDEKKEDYAKVKDFNLKNYNGQDVSLSDFSDQYLVINSWASWCPFCVKELSDFAVVQKEFKDQVVFIAINRSESLKVSKNFSDKQNISNDLIFLLDSKDSFYKSIGGFSMPETIFVDKDGNIIEHKRGPMEAIDIRKKVENLIRTYPLSFL